MGEGLGGGASCFCPGLVQPWTAVATSQTPLDCRWLNSL